MKAEPRPTRNREPRRRNCDDQWALVPATVRPENGSHTKLIRTSSWRLSKAMAYNQTERILRAALSCPAVFSSLGCKSHGHLLKHSLPQWKSLDFPHSRFSLVGKHFSEWFPEFEKFLDSYEFRSNNESTASLRSNIVVFIDYEMI